MDLQLKGKRALVTGSSSGIGAAIARMLVTEGASVVVHGRDAVKTRKVAAELTALGDVRVVIGDVSKEKDAQLVARAADEAFGGIDILVNNVGGRSERSIGFDVPPSEWIATYEKNVVSAVRLMHYFTPQMKERGWGRFIQISSGMGKTPIGQNPDYAASKAAMTNLSLNLSRALARTGITCNTVSPGMTRTPAVEEWLADVAASKGWGDDIGRAENYVIEELADFSVNRVGRPEDIAAGVVYLASPLADYVNGINLQIDGGTTPCVT